MQLEAYTHITKKMYRDYNWFNFLKVRRFRTWIPVILISYTIFIPIILYFYFIVEDGFFLILFGLLLFSVLLLALTLLYLPIKTYKTMTNSGTTENSIVFHDDGFSAHSNGSLSNSSQEGKYETFLKAYETDQYFFLYIGPSIAYVVPKSDFTMGSPEELRLKLREKLGNKFKERHR